MSKALSSTVIWPGVYAELQMLDGVMEPLDPTCC
jgi:hypothetical protein